MRNEIVRKNLIITIVILISFFMISVYISSYFNKKTMEKQLINTSMVIKQQLHENQNPRGKRDESLCKQKHNRYPQRNRKIRMGQRNQGALSRGGRVQPSDPLHLESSTQAHDLERTWPGSIRNAGRSIQPERSHHPRTVRGRPEQTLTFSMRNTYILVINLFFAPALRAGRNRVPEPFIRPAEAI